MNDINYEEYKKFVDTKLNFTTKREYLKWRSEWRQRYAALSHAIREGRT